MTRPARWTVRHVDLHAEPCPVASAGDADGQLVVLWWRDVPIGHLELARERLPLDGFAMREEILRALGPTLAAYTAARRDGLPFAWSTQYLERLRGALDRPLDSILGASGEPKRRITPSVSVVICTRSRPEALERCLRSLGSLSTQPAQVLVVDNSPSDARTRRVVEAHGDADYVSEPTPGLDRARNRGIRESTGEIIAYVDDDVSVHPRWLEHLLEGFDDARVLAVTGLVLPAELETRAQWLFEKYWGFHRGYVPRVYDAAFYAGSRRFAPPVWEIGAGANMAFRRSAFELLGGFDQRLDAGAAGVAGDSEFWYRVLAAGFSCRYQPSAVVWHWHRREMRELHQQIFAYMRGHVTALLIQHRRYGDRGNLRRLFASLPYYYAATSLRALRSHHRERAATLRSELKGCAAGLHYYLRTRKEAETAVPLFRNAPSARSHLGHPLGEEAR